MSAVLESTITCPACGHQTTEQMPTNACLFFYECPACQSSLRPLGGDCCVFCSYGTIPCPSRQTEESHGVEEVNDEQESPPP